MEKKKKGRILNYGAQPLPGLLFSDNLPENLV